MKPKRLLSYAQALQEAIDLSMAKDPLVFIIGEGVPDPKHIFGTTAGLREKYGPDRVMDMPVSENGLTGVCIGAAISGMRPILTHQRVDFSLLSFEQIVNNAAKWYFMFGGQTPVPLVIRMIIGRGWGQGAQHSQSLQALFAHIPGLKVIMPTTAYDAKGLLISAIEDNNPVISLEHRWLYNLEDEVPEGRYTIPIGKGNLLHKGNDLTIVATSYAAVESLSVAKGLEKHNIYIEVIDPRSLRPLDEQIILKSVAKTGRLLVVDTGGISYGVGAEIVAIVAEKSYSKLKAAPSRIGLPDLPTPSSPLHAKDYYPDKYDIAKIVLTMLGKKIKIVTRLFPPSTTPHDVPDLSFKGPF